MKNKYESNECEACGKNEETQEHVLNCEIILNMHEDYEKSEKEEYEKIENGSVKEKIKVAKLFIKNMKIIENFRRKKT